MRFNKQIKIIISFLILFVLYHSAEYMIMFENNAYGFFSFQILFFVTALFLGKWYSGMGLAAWGLTVSKKLFRLFFLGAIAGIFLYGATYLLTILSGIEKITNVPATGTIIKSSIPFTFGVLFSSLSEDVLTRGIIYSHFNNKIKPVWLILLSATIYLLNHIYRLGDGFETLLYIFLLGVIFIIPLLHTKNLWFTGGMHWAGNTFFFVSHDVIKTGEAGKLMPPNIVFAICIALFIPIIWFLTKKIAGKIGT